MSNGTRPTARSCAALLAMLLTGTATAAAQRPVNQTIPASATGTVEISNPAGQVRVIGWDRGEIRITGTLGAGVERLTVEGGGERTQIRVVLPRTSQTAQKSETRLEIHLPSRKDVLVRTASADVEVERVEGAVTGHSSSGDLRVLGSPREVTVHSTSGDVEVRTSTARVRAETTSGDIRVQGAVRERVSAESVSGDLLIGANALELQVRSMSGDMEIRGENRRVTVSTVSGDAAIRTAQIQYGSFESVSGGLRFEGGLQRSAAFSINSHSGDVELVLAKDVGATFQVSTFSGDIHNAFGAEARRVSRHAPGKELRFTSGGGDAVVAVKTFSGNVKLVRR